MEINTKSAVPAKISRAYQNDSKDAKSRFSTSNNMENVMQEKELSMTFSHGWKLFVTFEEHARMKRQLTVFSPTRSIVLSEFGLLTILSKKKCFGCGCCARNFALQGIGLCDSKLFGRIQNCILKHLRVVCKEWQNPLNYCLNATEPGRDMTKISTGFKEQRAQFMHRPRWFPRILMDKGNNTSTRLAW